MIPPDELSNEDLVFLLRVRAKIETAGDDIPVTHHLDWLAADEIERLRSSVNGLLDTIRKMESLFPFG